MPTIESQLPDRVTLVQLADNRQIYLVGTAHVSKESVNDVRQTVEIVNPDKICVELCSPRYQTLTQRDAWRKMDIFKVVNCIGKTYAELFTRIYEEKSDVMDRMMLVRENMDDDMKERISWGFRNV